MYLNENFKSGSGQFYFLVSKLLWGSNCELSLPFPEMKTSHFLGIKLFNSNKGLTVAERCNSFFPVPVGLIWFSLLLVRPVRNLWIRSLGAVPRTWFIWYQRILMCCQGPFCHWECRGWVCKELAEPEYKDKTPKQPILAGHLLSKATRDLHQETPPKRRMSKGTTGDNFNFFSTAELELKHRLPRPCICTEIRILLINKPAYCNLP